MQDAIQGRFEVGRTVVVRCRRRDGANERAICDVGTVRSHGGNYGETAGRIQVVPRSAVLEFVLITAASARMFLDRRRRRVGCIGRGD